MTDKPLVDPLCLCGKEHPCPDHGKWVHSEIRPQNYGPRFPDRMTVAERTDIDRRNWVLAKDMAKPKRLRLVQDNEEETGAA